MQESLIIALLSFPRSPLDFYSAFSNRLGEVTLFLKDKEVSRHVRNERMRFQCWNFEMEIFWNFENFRRNWSLEKYSVSLPHELDYFCIRGWILPGIIHNRRYPRAHCTHFRDALSSFFKSFLPGHASFFLTPEGQRDLSGGEDSHWGVNLKD